MSAQGIVTYLKATQPKLFSGLTRQVVARMIDYDPEDGGKPRWTDITLVKVQQAAEGKARPSTNIGILVRNIQFNRRPTH